MVIFHSYVKLPEGTSQAGGEKWENPAITGGFSARMYRFARIF